jgi:hypothetical protein
MMMLRIKAANKNEMLMESRKHKALKGWMNHPKKILYYKDKSRLGDLCDKPVDWSKQKDKYEKKVVAYEKEKM